MGNQNLKEGDIHVNLGGLGVGNGLTQPLIQYEYYAQLAYNYSEQKVGHPIITEQEYSQMVGSWPECKSDIADCQTDTSSCPNAQAFCNQAMMGPYEASGMNPYDIRKECGSNVRCRCARWCIVVYLC